MNQPTHRKTSLLGIGLASAIACAPASAMEAFSAAYQASAMGMQGNGQMVLSAQGNNRWEYALSIRNNLVDLSQKTVFEEAGGTLRPLSSSDVSRVLVKQKSVNTQYDWDKAQATWSGDVKADRAGPVALKPGDMDALLVNLAIVRDVSAGKPLNYRMIENGKAKMVSYKVAGKETINVGGKSREATKVVNNNGDKQMVVWVVPDVPVPVRILQREDGEDSIDLHIQSWK
ncbi:DUF3108 domain-containing protein [Pseudoxanthomonas dokdonensis]|uniref:DUF3108 domain-containing protein n=1 Tax=Pseudoxanthomonas dokdonensis TaxID=344882 RepID=A0A0R0CE03_9GAMM|nr:DUF3108 domain-containing protein [Pseudoxanthomonas dokdonensis]KRG67980.1 hypothetical protein ABB29_14455 [Pseudoxanthomonas dokdonensis]